jgi:oxygen-independent coproporphyrinogen-3 oxidase
MNALSIDVDAGLIQKYNSEVFMYGEYPHKSFWSFQFDEGDFRTALEGLFSCRKDVPLLLYVHIPFCSQQCFYCTCRTVVTRNYERIKNYLNQLLHEIDLFRNLFDKNSVTPNFREIHIGGGSPTVLHEEEFDLLIDKLQSIADIKNISEFALEIDPRGMTKEKLRYYHSKGINRVSFGVQEFDLDVQKAINRVQPSELLEELLTPEIRNLFTGINFDILCGLPRQTRESFRRTIDTVMKFSPERIALLTMCYSPDFSKHQKLMNESEIPDLYERTILFLESVQTLLNDGYVRIGLEHFAKPTDDLAKAAKNKMLFWCGLGYTPGRYHNVIGLGTSSTSIISGCYAHNVYELSEYEAAIKGNLFPIYRGHKIRDDDVIRCDIIKTLRSYFSLDYRQIEEKYDIEFEKYFKEEIAALDEFVKDGLVELSDNAITITELGKSFTGFVCRSFDRYVAVAHTA